MSSSFARLAALAPPGMAGGPLVRRPVSLGAPAWLRGGGVGLLAGDLLGAAEADDARAVQGDELADAGRQ